MPNWCSNSVTFKHTDLNELQRLVDAYNDGETMQTMFPCPCALRDTTSGFLGKGTPEQAALEKQQAENLERYGAKDWFDWCVANWGTKWDFGRKDHHGPAAEVKTKPDGTHYVELGFDTAWSPPIAFYVHLCDNRGFDIKAYYCEEGVGFCGVWHNGDDTLFDIREFTQEWLADHIPANICEAFNLYEQAAEREADNRTT